MRHSGRKGFTLAEVLITLGIIGIVAAMTIPTLIQKQTEKVTVTKVKKMYSTLSQAYLMNKAQDEIVLDNTQAQSDEAAAEVAKIFTPYLKITKDCGNNDDGCIYTGTYKYKNGSNFGNFNKGAGAYKVVLNDGATIWFRRAYDITGTNANSIIFYDVNGVQEPNTIGKDTFIFVVYNDRVLPAGDMENATVYDTDSDCLSKTGGGRSCTTWITEIGNMDYLHCDGLSMNGKHTCN